MKIGQVDKRVGCRSEFIRESVTGVCRSVSVKQAVPGKVIDNAQLNC
jgi:hypothetical protein